MYEAEIEDGTPDPGYEAWWSCEPE